MAQRSVTREIPRLEFRALVSPDTLNEEKRTVDVIWTTGARVLRGYFDQFWEELSLDPKHVRMERLNGGAPLLDSHDGYSLDGVIGVVESARLEAKRGVATVRFAKAEDDPRAEKIFRKIADGILRNVSVGYQINKMEKVAEEKGKVPVYRAVDWTPHEISIVPIGADAGAGVRSDKSRMNPCEFIEERAMENDDTTTPTPVPSPAPAPAPAPISAEMRTQIEQAATRAATERVLGIQRVGRTLNRPQSEIDAAVADPAMTLDKFRAAAVEALATASPEQGGTIPFDRRGHQIQGGADERDKFLRSSENWLIQRAGLTDMMREAAQKRGEKVDFDPGPARGRTLVELARQCLERAGVRTDGMDVMDMVGKAFTHRSGNSTSDFPILLENTLHKSLQAAAATVPDTWRQWCKKGTVSDFRAHTRYRQGGLGVLPDVAEGGEFKNADIKDGEKQTVQAGTKGRIIALTRQAIINDDMGAFNDMATRAGRAVALTVEVGAWTYLLSNPVLSDGVALFHANHGNLTAGALSVASIEIDRVAMANQLDVGSNDLLELRPVILLCPVGLGGEARVINQSQYDTDAIANKPSTKPNKVVGLYRQIIDTARLTGTARYSFADPNIEPVIEVAFLNGNEAPRMEMQQGWRVDGTEWKVALDVGFGALGYRGVVKSTGV
jgi:HK97 family phage prohead protease